jgi:polyhydroxybutyrate depolymerase
VSRTYCRARALWSCLIVFLISACTDNPVPPTPEAFGYPTAATPAACEPGAVVGSAGITDDESTAEGILYNVRTPSNYNSSHAHPMLMVYAPAGQSRRQSEQLTGLTSAATGRGFVVVYAEARSLSIPVIEQFSRIPGLVAKKWCVDQKKVYITGHSNGGTIATAIAVLDRTKHLPAAIAPSAAGLAGKDLEAYQCRAPIPAMVMHSATDNLFPGWGAQAAAWWAGCNQCEVAAKKTVEGGCVAYQHCAQGGPTLYCEGTGSHGEWPKLNRLMLDFFTHPETFH